VETLNLSFLGPLTVTRGGAAAPDFISRKAQALLAYLVLEAARAHSREELVALLWPDYPQESARASLRSVLANVRHVIGDRDADPPHLLISRESVQFDLASDCAVDVALLDAPPDLSAVDAPVSPGDVVAQLEATLHRASAPLLAGFSLPDSPPFEEWLLLRREAYARRVVALWGVLARHHEQRGDVVASLAAARRWEASDPWDEDAHRQIMRLLALQGHRGQAMAQFERCREVLVRELGVEPSDATVALAEQIRQGAVTSATVTDVQAAAAASGVVTSAPSSAAPGRTPHHVPKLLTPTVGRSQELTMLAELFGDRDRRLVTIVGPGGMGKTHLALEFATRHERRYPDGAAMVALAGLQSADGLAAAVADALRLDLRDHQSVDEQVQRYLASHHMLLVLDNCEHLPDVGPVVESWLESAPHLVVLATSRLRLHVRGEQLFPLGGLLVPPAEGPALTDNTDNTDNTDVPGTEAVDFFLQCAQRVRPRRRLTGDHPDMVHVRTICRMLDGMPLALLLAASWTESLTLPEIVRELGRGLDLLQVEDRAVPVRHQKITTVFAQAWSLLTADEQRVLARRGAGALSHARIAAPVRGE
jgi:DNA-binding SARP family transcriptional activator